MPASISDLPGIKGVSDRALAAIFKRLREEPELLEDVRDRNDLRALSQEVLSRVELTLEVPRAKGLPFTWSIGNARALLQLLTEERPHFEDLVRRTAAAKEPTFARPWNAIVYCDEVIPGNVLALQHRRKFAAFYMSFEEFGSYLQCEELNEKTPRTFFFFLGYVFLTFSRWFLFFGLPPPQKKRKTIALGVFSLR